MITVATGPLLSRCAIVADEARKANRPVCQSRRQVRDRIQLAPEQSANPDAETRAPGLLIIRRLTAGYRRANSASVTTSFNHQRPEMANKCCSPFVSAISSQIFRAQTCRFRQNGTGNGYLVVPCKATDNGRRCLGDGSKLPLISARAMRALISAIARSSMVFMRRSSTLSNSSICSPLNVPAEQKKICHSLDRLQALFRRAGVYCCFDFVDN